MEQEAHCDDAWHEPVVQAACLTVPAQLRTPRAEQEREEAHEGMQREQPGQMQKTSDIERVNDHVKAGHKEAKIAKIVGDSLACNEPASENADKGHCGPAGSKSLEKGTRDVKAIVNLNGCSYSVVGDACRRLGWKITKDDDKWTLRWVDRYCLGQTLRDMRLVRPQRINHFPAMCEIAFKCRLAENLNRMRHKLPADYSFFPQTFVLPDDLGSFERCLADTPNRTYIVKPNAGSQGAGIFFTRRATDIPKEGKYVAQKYLNKPLLIDGFKFDLRIYVLITSVLPLRVYVARKGLARFCTEPYESISKQNRGNQYKHLTNYAINKKSDAFLAPTCNDPDRVAAELTSVKRQSSSRTGELDVEWTHADNCSDVQSTADGACAQKCVVDEKGSKRSLSSVLRWLDANGFSSSKVQRDIDAVVTKTVLAALPANQHAYKASFPESRDSVGSSCFTILGVDIMLDSAANAWLIETNELPSFEADSALDHEVKMAVIAEALEMVHPTAAEMRLLKDLNASFQGASSEGSGLESLRWRRPHSKMEMEAWRKQTRKQILDLRMQHEVECCDTFEAVYPPSDNSLGEVFSRCLSASCQIFRSKFGAVMERPKPTQKSWEQCLRSVHDAAFSAGGVCVAAKKPVTSEDVPVPRVYNDWKDRMEYATGRGLPVAKCVAKKTGLTDDAVKKELGLGPGVCKDLLRANQGAVLSAAIHKARTQASLDQTAPAGIQVLGQGSWGQWNRVMQTSSSVLQAPGGNFVVASTSLEQARGWGVGGWSESFKMGSRPTTGLAHQPTQTPSRHAPCDTRPRPALWEAGEQCSTLTPDKNQVHNSFRGAPNKSLNSSVASCLSERQGQRHRILDAVRAPKKGVGDTRLSGVKYIQTLDKASGVKYRRPGTSPEVAGSWTTEGGQEMWQTTGNSLGRGTFQRSWSRIGKMERALGLEDLLPSHLEDGLLSDNEMSATYMTRTSTPLGLAQKGPAPVVEFGPFAHACPAIVKPNRVQKESERNLGGRVEAQVRRQKVFAAGTMHVNELKSTHRRHGAMLGPSVLSQ